MAVKISPITLGFDHCYIIQDEGTIMVDAGAPNKRKAFSRSLEQMGLKPEEIQLLVITHGHWDHIGSATDIKAITGARIAMHRLEKQWLEESLKPMPPGVTAWGHVLGALVKAFLPLIRIPGTEVDIAIGDEGLSLREYGIPGKVIHTPGHSSGSISILLDTGDAFVGDMVMNKFPLRLGPGLPIFAEDSAKLKDSLQLLLDQGAQTIYPAHGRPISTDVIRKALA